MPGHLEIPLTNSNTVSLKQEETDEVGSVVVPPLKRISDWKYRLLHSSGAIVSRKAAWLTVDAVF